MKYKEYSNYNDSGIEWIGDIPEGWEVKKLKHIFDTIRGGTTPTSSEPQEQATAESKNSLENEEVIEKPQSVPEPQVGGSQHRVRNLKSRIVLG